MPRTSVFSFQNSSKRDAFSGGLFFFAVVCALLGAIFMGLLATTASPIYIALGVGVMAGCVLLARLHYGVWIVLLGTLLINGLISLTLPQYSKISWLFSMLGFLLFAGSFVQVFAEKRRGHLWLPGFLVSFLLLFFYSIVISFFVSDGWAEALVGIKRYFQLFGLALFLALLPVFDKSKQMFRHLLLFLFVLALLQLPFAVFERIVLVPLREGLWKQGVVPIDVVSGTFESSLEGGGSSSVMVIFLVCFLGYLLSLMRDGVMSRSKGILVSVIVVAPLFLGETKIALILFPMVFIFVYGAQIRKNPFVGVMAILLGLGLTVVLGWIYFSLLATQGMTVEAQIDKALAYNFGVSGYYDRYSLNRTTAISFWFGEHGLHNIASAFFGHGIGSSYSGAGSLVPGHLSRDYPYMAINLTTLSSLLWDVGVFGTALFLYAFWGAWRAVSRLYREANDGHERARLMALKVSVAANAFAVLYSNSLISSLSHEAIVAFTFGYIAWLCRRRRFAEHAQIAA